MNLLEVLNVPKRKYRVFGRDNFDHEFFVVGDYEELEKAIETAKEKEKDEIELNGEDNDLAATFYVIDNRRNFLYGLIKIPNFTIH